MRDFLIRKYEKVRKIEMFAYATGTFGEQMIAFFVGSFVMFYFTDYVGIAPAAVGAIMFIPRIWDAINDPLMGVLADRTRTKYGRFRPYLLYAPIVLFCTTLVLYSVPSSLTSTMKLVWAFGAYFLWGMAYTALNIPNTSLVSVITKDTDKRSKIISMSKFAGMIGGGVPMLLVTIILKYLNNSSSSFTIMALIFGFLASIGLFTSFVFTRERVEATKERPKVFSNIVTLFKNKPLLILAIMGVLSSLIIWVSSGFRIYFLKYNLGNEALLAIFTIGLLPFNVLGLTLAPMVIKKLGSINSFIAGCLGRIAFSLAFFLIGDQSLISAIIWMGLIDVSLAIEGISIINMIIDCVDYGEYKFGVRTEGLFFSIQSFSGKLAGSLSTLITGFALTIVGYVPNITQSATTLRGIFVVFALMPGIAAVISLILMKIYPLKNTVMKEIKEELQLRKAESEVDE